MTFADGLTPPVDDDDSSDTETLHHTGYDGNHLRLFRLESDENDASSHEGVRFNRV